MAIFPVEWRILCAIYEKETDIQRKAEARGGDLAPDPYMWFGCMSS